MPNSYSMNARMVNRLGHRYGDMPRYLLWNEKPSRTRGSRNQRLRSPSTDRVGRSILRAFSTSGFSRSAKLLNGLSSTGRNAASLARLSAMKAGIIAASSGQSSATERCSRAMSLLAVMRPASSKRTS